MTSASAPRLSGGNYSSFAPLLNYFIKKRKKKLRIVQNWLNFVGSNTNGPTAVQTRQLKIHITNPKT